MVECTKICCGVVLLGEGLVLLCLAVGDSDRDLRVPPMGLVRVPPPATRSPIRPSFPQISHKGFVTRLAKQAAHCLHQRSDPALGICPRMEEAANGPSCHLSSGSLWGKVTQVVVGQRTQGRYQPSPQKCDVPLRITVNHFIILGNNYAGFPDRFQRVTGLVNPVGQELCYSCTTA